MRPDDAAAHSNLGCVLLERRDVSAACAAFREALRLKADYPEARMNLALALLANEVQFARYATLVARRGAKVVLECNGALKKLLSTVPGVRLIALQKGWSRPAGFAVTVLAAGLAADRSED